GRLSPGDYVLEIQFTHPFSTRAVSLYRMETGGDAYAFTQFEADEARSAFPCWDEPEYKIPWLVTVIAPVGEAVVANSPIARLAVPEFWYGAMENAGAVTFVDRALLIDPATATPEERRRMISTTAHELAHMWFGDLVTMKWWDDLWLNESFAEWMGNRITDQLHAELDTPV